MRSKLGGVVAALAAAERAGPNPGPGPAAPEAWRRLLAELRDTPLSEARRERGRPTTAVAMARSRLGPRLAGGSGRAPG
jgi:hypothetical protein